MADWRSSSLPTTTRVAIQHDWKSRALNLHPIFHWKWLVEVGGGGHLFFRDMYDRTLTIEVDYGCTPRPGYQLCYTLSGEEEELSRSFLGSDLMLSPDTQPARPTGQPTATGNQDWQCHTTAQQGRLSLYLNIIHMKNETGPYLHWIVIKMKATPLATTATLIPVPSSRPSFMQNRQSN